MSRFPDRAKWKKCGVLTKQQQQQSFSQGARSIVKNSYVVPRSTCSIDTHVRAHTHARAHTYSHTHTCLIFLLSPQRPHARRSFQQALSFDANFFPCFPGSGEETKGFSHDTRLCMHIWVCMSLHGFVHNNTTTNNQVSLMWGQMINKGHTNGTTNTSRMSNDTQFKMIRLQANIQTSSQSVRLQRSYAQVLKSLIKS